MKAPGQIQHIKTALLCMALLCTGCGNRQADVADQDAQAILLENVELREYEETGWPYFHDTLKNNTERTITAVEMAMLAYDEEGSPLELYWNFLDTETKPAYGCLRRENRKLLPGGRKDDDGGWSLYDGEKMKDLPARGDGGANRAAYGLFCVKRVEFDDGTAWDNPDYAGWLEEYQGKAQEVSDLQAYYPKEYNILPAE